MSDIEILRSCSYHAEKLLKKRADFVSVLLVVEYADHRRQFYELENDAPADATKSAVLDALAREIAEELHGSGAIAIAVAFPGTCRELSLLPESITRVPVVGFETHDIFGTHLRGVREIIGIKTPRPTLAAMSPLRPAAGSRYASILEPAVRLQAAS